MMSREDLQPIWEKLVDRGFSDYETLNKSQKLWFNLETLLTGGVVDYYSSFGAENVFDLIDSLVLLKEDSVKRIIMDVNSLFEKGIPPKSIDLRNDEIVSWSEEKNTVLEKNEELFWNSSEKLNSLLLQYLNENLDEISDNL